jgi:hypothetical protein
MSEILILIKDHGAPALGEMRTLARAFRSTHIHGYAADALISDIGKRGLEFADAILETTSPYRKKITAEQELRYALLRCYQEGVDIYNVFDKLTADIETVERNDT